MKRPEHQRVVDKAAAREETRAHRRKGKKPFALEVTTHSLAAFFGRKESVAIHRYTTERARNDAMKAIHGKEWGAFMGRPNFIRYTARKID